jgi:hypothetical protein
MKKVILIVALAALLVPLAALADNGPAPTPAQTANQLCQADKTAMGVEQFKQLYGTNPNQANAWGKCVSGKAKTAHAATQNASAACQSEQAQDQAAFDAKYGSDQKGKGADKDAMGKCVSAKVHDTVTTTTAKVMKAAKTCKAMRKSDASGYATKYGTKANAFGKCVAAKGK